MAALVGPFLAEVDRPLVFPFVPALLAWLVDHGIEPVIVTGAPAELVAGYVEPAGGRVVGLTLAESGGRYTGAIRRNPGTGRREGAGGGRAAGRRAARWCWRRATASPTCRCCGPAAASWWWATPRLAAEFPATSLLVEPRSTRTTGDDVCRGLERAV